MNARRIAANARRAAADPRRAAANARRAVANTRRAVANGRRAGAAFALACLTACSASNTATNAPTPRPSTALVTPAPQSMTPRPMHNCAQPGPAVHFVDAYTGRSIDLAAERIVATIPAFFSPALADRWIVQRIAPPHTLRSVAPRVPAIVGAVVLGSHDESTVEILPAGTLADDYLRHIAFVVERANLASEAKAANKPLASPAPADVSREERYLKTELGDVQAATLGSPPDDDPFGDDEGEPNAADPHRYLFACKFLESRPYTLVLRTLVRKLRKNASYRVVLQRLTAEHAQDDAKARTGYEPDAYITLAARNVSPTLARYALLDSVKQLLKTYSFVEIARMKIAPMSGPK